MNLKITPYIYIVLIFFGKFDLQSQNIELKIKPVDTLNSSVIDLINYQRFHPDDNSITKELDSVSKKLKIIGYFNNKIIETIKNDSLYISKIKLNKKIEFAKISFDNSKFKKNTIRRITNDYSKNTFTIKTNEIPDALNFLLNYFEEQGNSFVQLSLKNITQHNDTIKATLYLNNSSKRKIDKIIVNKYTNFPKSFIKNYLNLKENSIFNTSKLEFASDAIQSLSFVSEIKPPEVLFTKDSTTIYLYLDKLRSNKFDGLIGFSTNDRGKLNFNGYLDLLLNNIFNSGEQFSINWKSNSGERKLFNININTPYIFNSKFSPNLNFNIYKQDSTFLNIKTDFNLKYSLNPHNSIIASFQSENSNNLNNTPTNNIEEFSNSFFGVSYEYKKINPINPFQNKFKFNINTLFGKRFIQSNSIKDNQQKINLGIEYNWLLNKRNIISLKNNSQLLISDNYYTNELFRIGGSNSIRGFNEESIFSSSHAILNIEYQYYLQSQSYLYSITDFAYVENLINNTQNNLYSLGIGYTYKIKSGFIDMSYAIGKQSNIPFNINNSRFHIKLIQLF